MTYDEGMNQNIDVEEASFGEIIEYATSFPIKVTMHNPVKSVLQTPVEPKPFEDVQSKQQVLKEFADRSVN